MQSPARSASTAASAAIKARSFSRSGGTQPPAFVGGDYLCESPHQATDPSNTSVRFYDTTDTLWDGQELAPECVGAAESAPDFHTDLGVVHTEPIEMRLLQTEGSTNENTEIMHLELWVR